MPLAMMIASVVAVAAAGPTTLLRGGSASSSLRLDSNTTTAPSARHLGSDPGWQASQAADGSLVFKDLVTAGDHRVVFLPHYSADLGTPQAIPGPTATIPSTFPGWALTEENGILVLRSAGPTDTRYAFYPGSYVDFGCGAQVAGLSTHTGSYTLFRGQRWAVTEENGVLVFRDTLSAGDSRYAFYPGCGVQTPGAPELPSSPTPSPVPLPTPSPGPARLPQTQTQAFSLGTTQVFGHRFEVVGSASYTPGSLTGPGNVPTALSASVSLDLVVDSVRHPLGTVSTADLAKDFSVAGLPSAVTVAGITVPLPVSGGAHVTVRVVPRAASASGSQFQVVVGARVTLDGALSVNLGLTGASVYVHGAMVDASATIDVTYTPGNACVSGSVAYSPPSISAGASGWVRVCTPAIPGWCAIPGGCIFGQCWGPTGCVPGVPEQCLNQSSDKDTGLVKSPGGGSATLFQSQCTAF